MVTQTDFNSIQPAWCPGCGDFGILNALKKALVKLEKKPNQVLLCSGIGQAAKLPHYLKCNVFNGLHGRGLPAAQGAKIVNRDLTVIAVGGDGDMYGEGGNHFIHAMRRNLDITLLVHDNRIYGLTKGQASPTSDLGMKTKIQPHGVSNTPLNPIALAVSQSCSFVARAYSGNIEHLTEMIQLGIKNKGFSLIDILQPCVSFNKVNTHAWYKERVYDIQSQDLHYDPTNMPAALNKSYEWGKRIPIGVLFEGKRETFADHWEVLHGKPLVDQSIPEEAIQDIINSFL
ncbi:2-oxoacid:ferredoxin oxidoreductase subunit beta [bacterium]|nr:2-oxoacid:ferredoxin oxidoreductase subunit beta [bacterium]